MHLTIFGSGYVGLVTGACMAEMGNHVICVDIDAAKIDRLNAGEVPIYEPGLNEYLERNREAGRLEFTTDIAKGVNHGLFQFIAIGKVYFGSWELSGVGSFPAVVVFKADDVVFAQVISTLDLNNMDRLVERIFNSMYCTDRNVCRFVHGHVENFVV